MNADVKYSLTVINCIMRLRTDLYTGRSIIRQPASLLTDTVSRVARQHNDRRCSSSLWLGVHEFEFSSLQEMLGFH
jgi:hypothetical protein